MLCKENYINVQYKCKIKKMNVSMHVSEREFPKARAYDAFINFVHSYFISQKYFFYNIYEFLKSTKYLYLWICLDTSCNLYHRNSFKIRKTFTIWFLLHTWNIIIYIWIKCRRSLILLLQHFSVKKKNDKENNLILPKVLDRALEKRSNLSK